MKIIYIANVRFPTEKAHGIQIMKMCEAFANNGHEIELVIPSRSTSVTGDPFTYYSIKKRFPIKRIFVVDLLKYGKFWFYVESLSFAISAFLYTLFKKKDVIFGRDELPLLMVSLHSKTVWETHRGGFSWSTKLLLRSKTLIVAITKGLKDFYIKNGVEPKRILIASDSVDVEQFDIKISKEEARKKLGLPQDKQIVLYTGHLYDWKGTHVLAQAAKFLPESILTVFVGGTDHDVKSFKERFGSIQNVSILGKKPYDLMPLYMKAADVLSLPNSPVNDISSLYTSPMKLFEYMASGSPIIASDLPSLREILSEHNAVLVKPDEPKLLADGVRKILTDHAFAERIGAHSYTDSKNYTWEKRAEVITSFIKA